MKVEIWSDLICPWCYIGKRRFEKALKKENPQTELTLIWRSFELDPSAPTQLMETLEEMLSRKYDASLQEAKEMNARVTRAAAAEGLTYRLEYARPGNTFAAHRLLHYAEKKGLGEKLTERLMRGYFSESLSIGEHSALLQAAIELGLDRDETQSVLDSDQFAAEVRADEQRANRLGINGVPFFLFDEKLGISGVQPLEVFEKALRG